MNEFFALLLAAGALFGLLVAPIWCLVAILRLHRRFDEESARQNAALQALRRELGGAAELTPSATTFVPPLPIVSPPKLPPAPPAYVPVAVGAASVAPAPLPPPAALPPVPPPPRAPMPPPAPEPPPDSGVGRLLQTAWNWLLVGEEYRKPGISVEVAVATNWLTRVGVLVVLAFVGFFLKHSIDQGLLGPTARVALCFASGAAGVAGGLRLFGRRYHLLGQGLVAAGVATLYFAVFAATNLYALLPVPAGFGLMALVTAVAGVIAVRFRTFLPALLGTLGGYLTPVMLRTAERHDLWLFGYLLVLAAGVTVVAWRRNWPALTYICVVCHNLVFFSALDWAPHTGALAVTLPFFAAYFALFTTAVFSHGLSRGEPASTLELAGLFGVAAIFFGGGYDLVKASFGKASVAWLTLGMAAYYTAHVYWLLHRATRDRRRLAAFLGLAAGALALTLPLVLSHAWLTMSWAVLATCALWVGVTLDSPFLRGIGLALYALVAAKLGLHDLGYAYAGPAAATHADYARAALDRAMQFGVPVASFWLGARLLRRVPRDDVRLSDAARLPAVGTWGVLALVSMYGLLFLFLNLETYAFWQQAWPSFGLTGLTVIWAGFGLYLLARGPGLRPGVLGALAGLALLLAAGKLCFDFTEWHPQFDHGRYGAGYAEWGGAVRLFDVALGAGFLAWAWRAWRNLDATRPIGRACGYVALAVLFLHVTFETGTAFGRYVPEFRAGAISVAWTLYAFGLVFVGIRCDARPLRYMGLALFAVVVLKVFLSDLRHLAAIYRIVASGVLGGVLLLAAFLYLRPAHGESKEHA